MNLAKPILFNGEMVRAILDGRKTSTRRTMKPQLPDHCPNCMIMHNDFLYDNLARNVYCSRCGEPLYNGGFPYKAPYRPGDILYVRETWTYHENAEGGIIYKARCPEKLAKVKKWHPSIHMPKEAARIWLKVTDVRVERLQDITDDGVEKEGLPIVGRVEKEVRCLQAFSRYQKVWNSTIKKPDLDRYSWEANPWVWVIEFERCEKPDGRPE